MKKARLPDNRLVEASAEAPKLARCPDCGGEVILRHRKRMITREVSYFWRHRDYDNLRCPLRHRLG